MSEWTPKILVADCSQCGRGFELYGGVPHIPPTDGVYECPYCHAKTHIIWDKEIQREVFRKKAGLTSFDARLDQLCVENKELEKKIDALEAQDKILENKLSDVNNTTDNRTKETTEIISKLTLWVKKYGPILDGLDKEYRSLTRKQKDANNK